MNSKLILICIVGIVWQGSFGSIHCLKEGDILQATGYGSTKGKDQEVLTFGKSLIVIVNNDACNGGNFHFCAKYLNQEDSCAADMGSPVYKIEEGSEPVLAAMVTKLDHGPLNKCSHEHTVLRLESMEDYKEGRPGTEVVTLKLAEPIKGCDTAQLRTSAQCAVSIMKRDP